MEKVPAMLKEVRGKGVGVAKHNLSNHNKGKEGIWLPWKMQGAVCILPPESRKVVNLPPAKNGRKANLPRRTI